MTSSPAHTADPSRDPSPDRSGGLTGKEVRLAARPTGRPVPADFAVVTVAIPDPGPGQVLIRNTLLSLEAGSRLRMSDVGIPVPPYAVGEALTGDAVGEVVASVGTDLAVGETVVHPYGWREYAVADAAHVRRLGPDTRSPRFARSTLPAHLATGLTAWAGLVDVAGLKPGETVFVSSAAGSVGALAGQIARLKGAARVVGSAGSPAKITHLVETLGFDAAFDRHDGAPADRLREVAPDGIDVYFDNTGGAQLEAALEVMNPYGRVALCGALARQNGTAAPAGPANLALAIGKRITLRGFLTSDHLGRSRQVEAELAGWVGEGRLRLAETVIDGLDGAPAAFVDLLRGAYTGKVIVRLPA